MPYLTSVSQEQVGRGPYSGTVRVIGHSGTLSPTSLRFDNLAMPRLRPLYWRASP